MATAVAAAAQPIEQSSFAQHQHWTYRQRGRVREKVYRLVYLRAWREAVHWERYDLAAFIYADESTIKRLEQGKALANISMVLRLADVFGIDAKTLIDEPPPDRFPRDHAFGGMYFIAEADGELCFKLPYLWYYLAYPSKPGLGSVEELAARTGLDAGELEAICEEKKSAPYSWMQKIAAALEIPLMGLIYDQPIPPVR